MAKEGQPAQPSTPQWNPNEETLTAFLDGLESQFNNQNITDGQKRVSYLIDALPLIIRNALKIGSDQQQIDLKDYHQIIDDIKQQLLPQAKPPKSKWWHRAQLHQRRQKSKESIQEYKDALLALATNCHLHYHQDITLTMAFISGLRSKSIRKRLLGYQEELNFSKATDYAVELEAQKTTDNTDQNNDNSVTIAGDNGDSNPNHDTDVKPNNDSQQEQHHNRNTKSKKACYRCSSYSHVVANCSYKRLYCHWCGRKGHIERECYDKQDYYDYY